MSSEHEEFSEVEIAILDAIQTLAEVIIYAHPGADKYLQQAFQQQARGHGQRGQPNGAAVHELLRQFAAAPLRPAAKTEMAKRLGE